MKYMFDDCLSLSFFPFFDKWKINPGADFEGLFRNCISLSYLPKKLKYEYKNFDKNCFQLIKKIKQNLSNNYFY